jgi:hypothetical protein
MRSSKGFSSSLVLMTASLALLNVPKGAAAWPRGGPDPTSASTEDKSAPLSQEQTFQMLAAKIPSRQIEAFARRDGVDFKVTPELERDLRKAGATESLVQLLKKMGNAPPPAQDTGPAGSAEISTLLQTAEDALTRKDFAEAAKASKALIAKQPDMPGAWFDLGFADTGLHQPVEAFKAYQ